MRLPASAHTSRPWRIHELAHGFRVEDVWALPTPGGPNDFLRLVSLMAADDPSQGSSRTATALWAIRPFRHLVVYPAMMRRIERAWNAGAGGSPKPPAQ